MLQKLKFSEPLEVHQWRIQEFSLGGPSPPPFPLPVRSRVPLKPARRFGGSTVRSRSRVWGRVPAENVFLVHSIAVRKQLVAIILSILKCMFYSCQLSRVPLRRQSVVQRGGGAEPARPPLNLPLCTTLTSRHYEIQTSSCIFQVPVMFCVI